MYSGKRNIYNYAPVKGMPIDVGQMLRNVVARASLLFYLHNLHAMYAEANFTITKYKNIKSFIDSERYCLETSKRNGGECFGS